MTEPPRSPKDGRAGSPKPVAADQMTSATPPETTQSDSSSYPSLSPSPEQTDSPPQKESSGAETTATDVTDGRDQHDFADGLTDRLFRSKSKGPVAAIFIHAGAGFHSTTNEHVHLEACSKAAQVAMKFLKAGGTAVDAVEAAIKYLEDKEITNAGYGSNLSIDGMVEGDATIVDHLGRSGACGAVPMVKNPVSLARLILDRSNIPLSLRRIPPNILVGSGARRFAEEHGMRLVPNDQLVSASARDRFYRWRQDLMRAEMLSARQGRGPLGPIGLMTPPKQPPVPPVPSSGKTSLKPKLGRRRERTSPPETTVRLEHDVSAQTERKAKDDSATPSATSTTSPPGDAVGAHSLSALPPGHSTYWPPRAATPHPKRLRTTPQQTASHDEGVSRRRKAEDSTDGASADFWTEDLRDEDTDIITDTVGAIAVDLRGNIAAGSSSGGIGMKHSGRIGPAALVGIGTAVVPADPTDNTGTSVAAVTSGTGEHMATTMASHTCAERLYYSQRRSAGGTHVSDYDDDAVMKSFVMDDFMGHPGVKNQISGGAIGVMAVKKTLKGIYFYYSHNTDSFALASMASNEAEPLVVMSRMGPREGVARGGRKIKMP